MQVLLNLLQTFQEHLMDACSFMKPKGEFLTLRSSVMLGCSDKGEAPNLRQKTNKGWEVGKVLFFLLLLSVLYNRLAQVVFSLCVEFDGGEGRVASS